MSQAPSQGGEIARILSDIRNKKLAHTNLFQIILSPDPSNLGTLMQFRAKGTQLPSSDLGTIEVPYRGRKLKVPGQRTFSEWTVTIMETEEMSVRNEMEKWLNSFDESTSGKRGGQTVNAIVQLMKSDTTTASISYTLWGVYPSNISAVELSFDEQTAPLEYSVTFQYSYHTVGSFGGVGGGYSDGSGTR
jgi:hypothetical protein